MNINLNKAKFVISANAMTQLPFGRAEVAFAGRSNAGKSTALNKLTNIKGLAKSSKTPGRTQLINYFEVAEEKFLVDLPGYGFAKVPARVQNHWLKFMNAYLSQRESLKGVIMLMDIRHPLTNLDLDFLELLADVELPVHILLTKADKIKRSPAMAQEQKVLSTIKNYDFKNLQSIKMFSSTNNIGVQETIKQITDWLE